MKSINDLLKRKPHAHKDCHFMYLNEEGERLNIFNPRNGPMPLKMVVDGKNYVIAPFQIHQPNYKPQPGSYITTDVTPEQVEKLISIALNQKETEQPLTIEQRKKITKYMRDHARRYGVLYKTPQLKIVSE
jgi:hypothetical protein